MPKSKQTKTKKTVQTKSKPEKLKPAETDDQIRIRLLKTEVHYFKGLAISITVLIMCVFVAFGVLFSAMYLEARATRVIFQYALRDILRDGLSIAAPGINEQDATADDLGDEEVCCDTGEDEIVADEDVGWLWFSKYGFTAHFPNSWTYFDRPYEKQVYFFADGVVRPDNSADIGDFVAAVVERDKYKDDYQGTLATIGNKIGYSYDLSNLRVVVVPFDKNYVELKFNQKNPFLTDELIKQFLARFEFSEK